LGATALFLYFERKWARNRGNWTACAEKQEEIRAQPMPAIARRKPDTLRKSNPAIPSVPPSVTTVQSLRYKHLYYCSGAGQPSEPFFERRIGNDFITAILRGS
jgi:hypothetical protein